jgi:ribulose-phosphate 3-epimerase
MMPKLKLLRAAVDTAGLDVWLQVDGGINESTIEIAAASGADTFVAGSSVFNASNPAAQVELLRTAAEAHVHHR